MAFMGSNIACIEASASLCIRVFYFSFLSLCSKISVAVCLFTLNANFHIRSTLEPEFALFVTMHLEDVAEYLTGKEVCHILTLPDRFADKT